jgi:23S rRNA (cytidine1920-2'-O)/16S rRNA (cytidine1409-2'-O)-methyltransferase
LELPGTFAALALFRYNPAMTAKPRKVRLDELVLARGLAASRTQAQRLILAGQVRLGDQVADKVGQLVAEDAPLRVEQGLAYVSRGGLKLAAALAAFGVQPAGWVCADIGASTGGFTDCLLQHGAGRVYAVDVGYGQLAWSLRNDPRVISIERTNIRLLESLPEPVMLATADVSFIGLGLVLPNIVKLLAPDGQVIALIKPQFEVGKGQVGKGGVVRDPKLHRAVIQTVLAQAGACGLAPGGVIRSPITGPAGNVEFLAWLRLNAAQPPADAVGGWLDACLPR